MIRERIYTVKDAADLERCQMEIEQLNEELLRTLKRAEGAEMVLARLTETVKRQTSCIKRLSGGFDEGIKTGLELRKNDF